MSASRGGRRRWALPLAFAAVAAAAWGLWPDSPDVSPPPLEAPLATEPAARSTALSHRAPAAHAGPHNTEADDAGSMTTIQVQVDDVGGGPIPGATVVASRISPYWTHTATTDARGRAEVEVPAARFYVRAEAEGYAPRGVHLELAPRDVHLKLTPAGRIAGWVVGADGRGLAAHVSLDPGRALHVDADADGHFVFATVHPGRFRPYATARGLRGEADPIAVTPGSTHEDLRIELLPTSAVLVDLAYEDGAPCPDPWLSVDRQPDHTVSAIVGAHDIIAYADEVAKNGEPPLHGLTQDDLRTPGRALAIGLPAGRYTLSTRCTTDEDGIDRPELQLGRGELRRLAFRHPRTGRIEGKVTFAGGESPRQGLVKAEGEAGASGLDVLDREGRFGLALAPGRYVLRAEATGAHEGESQPATVLVRPADVARVDLIVEPYAELRVKVEGPEGRPIRGAKVRASGDKWAWKDTDAEGWARLHLPPGRYEVGAKQGSGEANARVDLSAPGAELTLVIEQEEQPRCEGVVIDAEGRPVADARVVLTIDGDLDGIRSHTRAWLSGGGRPDPASAITDLEGHFELPIDHPNHKRLWARAAAGLGRGLCQEGPTTVRLMPTAGRLIVTGGVDGAMVHTIQLDGPFFASKPLRRDGSAAFEGLPPGTYAAVLEHAEQIGYAQGELRDQGPLTLRLERSPRPPAEPVPGVLLGRDAAPIANEYLFAIDPVGDALGRSTRVSLTDEAGRFVVEPRPHWPVMLRLRTHEGCLDHRLRPNDGPLELRMKACRP